MRFETLIILFYFERMIAKLY